MKKVANSLFMGLCGAAIMAAGCGGGGGGGGGGGSGGSSGGGGVALLPNDTGWVEGADNSLGVQGAWYVYGDGTDGTKPMGGGDCQVKGMHPDSDCSVISKPTPGSGSFPPSDLAMATMCTEGTVAKVIDIVGMTGSPDYSNIWGTGIGLDLAAGKDGSKSTFDADAKGVKGLAFDIDMVPMPKLRVEIVTTATKGSSAGDNYWNASMSYPPSPVKPGHNEVMWADFKGPKGAANDTAHIEAIHFHVPTTTTSSASYKYCISNLKLLM
jgi:hypothetical protein